MNTGIFIVVHLRCTVKSNILEVIIEMTQYSVFSTEVRCSLTRKGWNFSDLACEISKRTGMYCSAAYVSRILSGKRNPPKILAAIREILDLPEEKEESA